MAFNLLNEKELYLIKKISSLSNNSGEIIQKNDGRITKSLNYLEKFNCIKNSVITNKIPSSD